jgi:hypothetical protein
MSTLSLLDGISHGQDLRPILEQKTYERFLWSMDSLACKMPLGSATLPQCANGTSGVAPIRTFSLFLTLTLNSDEVSP